VSDRVAQLRPLVSHEPLAATAGGVPSGQRPGTHHVWPAGSP
jgi:hypothetical protein